MDCGHPVEHQREQGRLRQRDVPQLAERAGCRIPPPAILQPRSTALGTSRGMYMPGGGHAPNARRGTALMCHQAAIRARNPEAIPTQRLGVDRSAVWQEPAPAALQGRRPKCVARQRGPERPQGQYGSPRRPRPDATRCSVWRARGLGCTLPVARRQNNDRVTRRASGGPARKPIPPRLGHDWATRPLLARRHSLPTAP